MAYRNTFFRWLFLYSLTFGLTYVLKLFTYLCPETGQFCGKVRCHDFFIWMESLTGSAGFFIEWIVLYFRAIFASF